jgi:endonuclease YncB( thermonuclease family)
MSVVASMRTRKLGLFVRLPERLRRALRANLPSTISCFALALAFVASVANASPLNPGQVEALDGDTIRIAGETFRLVGFDAPETYRARCPSELSGFGSSSSGAASI